MKTMHSPFNQHQTFVVLGLGQTGLSVVRYLESIGEKMVVLDTRSQIKEMHIVEELKAKGIDVHLGIVPERCFSSDCVWVVSPGIALDHPWIVKALQHQVRLENDLTLFAMRSKARLALITGTNGKSTVTALLAHLIAKANLPVQIGGNFGIPALSLLEQHVESDTVCVLEISSFQLEIATHLKASVATCLNLTPDHLDRHHTMENYLAIKHHVFNNCECAVVHKSDANTIPRTYSSVNSSSKEGSKSILNTILYYHLGKPAQGEWGIELHQGVECFSYQSEFFIPVSYSSLVGDHNKLNTLSALAMAYQLGVPLTALTDGVRSFEGLEHRCQLARDLDGVKWINDSKGTNVDASLVAISGTYSLVPGKVYLIAGGDAKGADLQPMADIVTDRMPLVVLLGKDAPRFEMIYRGVTSTVTVKNMDEAVKLLAEKVKPGDAVLLSPASASIDMYENYKHRGKHFTDLVKGLNSVSTSSTT